MSNIKEVIEKSSESLELQETITKQLQSLQQAKKIIQELSIENKKLKELLIVSATDKPLKPTEQLICETQIEQLRETALERQLTLEETKRLDLLVKNLLLSKGSMKDIKPDYRTIPKGLTADSLLAIAASNTEEI